MHRRPTLTFVLVAVAVVSASVAGILVNRLGPSNSSPSTLAVRATTAFDFNATLGLNLTLTINPITAAEGRFTYMSASIVNPNSKAVVLQPTTTEMRVSAGPCSQLPLAVGISSGNFGRNNLSEARLGTIYNLGVIWCPSGLVDIDRFSFTPHSGNVTILTTSSLILMEPAKVSTQAWGFWTPAPRFDPLFPCCFHSFLPGVYTVIAQDEWGQLVITHFEVTDVLAFPDCNSVASNSTFVRHFAGIVAPGPLSASDYFVDPSDNESVFLPVTNELTRSTSLIGVVDPPGNWLYNFQGNAAPRYAGQSWYALAPAGAVEYPFSLPAETCSLLHVNFGRSIWVGSQLRLLLSDGVNETLTVRG